MQITFIELTAKDEQWLRDRENIRRSVYEQLAASFGLPNHLLINGSLTVANPPRLFGMPIIIDPDMPPNEVVIAYRRKEE